MPAEAAVEALYEAGSAPDAPAQTIAAASEQISAFLERTDGPAVRAERAPLNQVLRRWLALKESAQ